MEEYNYTEVEVDNVSNLPASGSFTTHGGNLMNSPTSMEQLLQKEICVADASYDPMASDYSNSKNQAAEPRTVAGIRRESRPAITPWEFQEMPISISSTSSSKDSVGMNKNYQVGGSIGRKRAKSGSSAAGTSDIRRSSIFWRLTSPTNDAAKLKRCVCVHDTINNNSCYVDVSNIAKDANTIKDKIFKKVLPREKDYRLYVIGLRNGDVSSTPELNELMAGPITDAKLVEICSNFDHPRRGDLTISQHSLHSDSIRKVDMPVDAKKKSETNPMSEKNDQLTPRMLKVILVN